MLTPGGWGQVCRASCRASRPAQGRGQAASELERGLTLQTIPFQGLLIPLPAAGHVNPDLSDQATCPEAANPPACDVRLNELTSLPGRALAQRSVPRARPQRRQSACQLAFKVFQGSQTCCTCSLQRWATGLGERGPLGPWSLPVKGDVKILQIHRAAGLAGWEAFSGGCLAFRGRKAGCCLSCRAHCWV